jgi:general L-amino acid transport system permease protein
VSSWSNGDAMTTERPASDGLPPPVTEVGTIGWLRKNLFSSWSSSLATIIITIILVVVCALAFDWAISTARWGVITSNMRLFLVGLFPRDEIWRVWTAMLALSLVAGLSAGTWRSGAVRLMTIMLAAGQLTIAGFIVISGLGIIAALAVAFNGAVAMVAMVAAKRYPVGGRWLLLGWAVSAVLTAVLLYGLGEATPLPAVSTSVWGGLMLTILLSVVAIALSFPIGVLLALGRRSELPVLRILSTTYIELIRAVPLVTVLFMAALLFPLVLPDEIRVDNVIRAMGGLTLFTAAYIAENVRGGLQAIPNGQVEAAQAIGLRGWQVNVFIVLPQALRIVIPANVGQFISLLKDTTLVFIVGLLEILGIGRAVLAQSDWLGASFEVYAFVAAVFFVLSYTLSQASYRLEKELGASD